MTFSNKVKQQLLDSKLTESKEKLKQLFLKYGAVTDPNLDYHLEISFLKLQDAQSTQKLLIRYGLNPKIILRKKSYVLYIKESEQISDFLALIGASESVVELQEVKLLRGVKNNVNRAVNCETANINKTINSAVKQVELIKLLKQKGLFEMLDLRSRELAEARLKHSDMSLTEIGQMLTHKLTKSGVSHKFKKMEKLLIQGE